MRHRRLLLIALWLAGSLLPVSSQAIGFCANGPFTHTAFFQRSAGSVAVPRDDGGGYFVLQQQESTYTGCTSIGLLPSISSSISSSYGNGGNATAPGGVGLPAGFSGVDARRFTVDGTALYFQTFYAITMGGQTLYCGFDGGVCDASLLGLQISNDITVTTYTLLVVPAIQSFIGSSFNANSGLGRVNITTGVLPLLSTIYIDVEAGLNYVFSQASCDLVDAYQALELPATTVDAVLPGSYVSSTDFDIRLNNCVVPRSLVDGTNVFQAALIRVTFLPASGQLVAGSQTDLRPLDQGQPGVAEGVAFRLENRDNGAPVLLDGVSELTAPFGSRLATDTEETFSLRVGLVKVNGETVTSGLVSGAVTFQVEYR